MIKSTPKGGVGGKGVLGNLSTKTKIGLVGAFVSVLVLGIVLYFVVFKGKDTPKPTPKTPPKLPSTPPPNSSAADGTPIVTSPIVNIEKVIKITTNIGTTDLPESFIDDQQRCRIFERDDEYCIKIILPSNIKATVIIKTRDAKNYYEIIYFIMTL